MASYVVDASVVIEYLVTGPYTPYASALFNQITSHDRLVVPEFCLLECANVLWKQVRFQGMDLAQAELLLKDLRKLPLTRVPVKIALTDAFHVGVAHQLAIYDSAYITLAKRSQYPLITLDQPQSRVAQAEGVSLKAITDFT